jgi:hypothetical protein
LQLIGVTAKASNMVELEMVSGLCLRMRKDMGKMKKHIKNREQDKRKLQQQVGIAAFVRDK